MRKLVLAAVAAGILSIAAITIVGAHDDHSSNSWPTTCVDLNDIVEDHLGNQGNVGIYQRTFGDQAEQACQNDHRNDVRGVFAWAFPEASSATMPGAAPAPPPASSLPTEFGNGSFEVGVDVAPGTYRSAGPADARIPFCSFARLKTAGASYADLDQVIDIQNVQGPAIVTIDPSDGGFFSQNCQTWVRR